MHAGKCYKALIDSGAFISLIRYSTYQALDSSFKPTIQTNTTKLNTADGSPMTALGITALHLRIADFKFTHNFIICNRLPDMEILFGIDIQRKFSLSYAWDNKKNSDIQKATIGIVKSTLKIHPDIMASSQSRSKAIQLKDIWHISSTIKIQQKERIPI